MAAEVPVQEGCVPHAGPRGRWAHTYAAVDLGTNNCRLLVARPDGESYRVTDSFSRIVRLGEGLAANGALNEAAMARTIKALRVCAAKIRRGRVSRARSVATEACRRAANCETFLARARAETGLDLDLISADDEARLTLAGCASLLDIRYRHALLFDIGGGSTELIWLALEAARPPHIVGWTSLPLGVVTLAERFGGREVTGEVYRAMVAEAEAAARPSANAMAAAGRPRTFISSAPQAPSRPWPRSNSNSPGTTARRWMAAGSRSRTSVPVSARLLAMDYRARIEHPCIRRGRADLVIAGCAVLEAIVRVWPAARLRVAGRGLREGLILSMMREADDEAGLALSG